jgi:hypothetical protein
MPTWPRIGILLRRQVVVGRACELWRRLLDGSSAISSLAPAGPALQAWPSLRHGNRFRRSPGASSRQTASLRDLVTAPTGRRYISPGQAQRRPG